MLGKDHAFTVGLRVVVVGRRLEFGEPHQGIVFLAAVSCSASEQQRRYRQHA
jgi:hypothetical protein